MCLFCLFFFSVAVVFVFLVVERVVLTRVLVPVRQAARQCLPFIFIAIHSQGASAYLISCFADLQMVTVKLRSTQWQTNGEKSPPSLKWSSGKCPESIVIWNSRVTMETLMLEITVTALDENAGSLIVKCFILLSKVLLLFGSAKVPLSRRC